MQDFTSQLLRAYFSSTDWHPHNSYLHLTSFSSSILLDFAIPSGLSVSISSTPSPIFYSTHRLRALPQLAGSLGYVFASTDKPLGFGHGRTNGVAQDDLRLRDVLERFRIVNVPSRPQGRVEVGPDGEAKAKRDYLLYGCIHAPTARLDALYTTRIAPTWNLIVTACSFPPRPPPLLSGDQHSSNAMSSAAAAVASGGSPGATNLQLTLQNDTGKWFNEFSYSVDDALWGFRTMHHFGPSQRADSASSSGATSSAPLSQTSNTSAWAVNAGQPLPPTLRTDEDSSASEVGGGLKGRFSAGAELFLSASEKSAGLSTGVRFTTLPEEEDADSAHGTATPPSQPPTTITATLNPMMGHLSTAYAARIGRDIVACSRYDFNVYSYDSELTVGGEYWLRSAVGSSREEADQDTASSDHQYQTAHLQPHPIPANVSLREKRPASAAPPVNVSSAASRSQSGVVPASNPIDELAAQVVSENAAAAANDRVSRGSATHLTDTETVTPRLAGANGSVSEKTDRATSPMLANGPSSSAQSSRQASKAAPPTPATPPVATTSGLLKWSLNSSLLLSLLWQGRLRNCLVAVGIKADLGGGVSATAGQRANRNSTNSVRRFQGGMGSVIRGIGMDIVYWGGGAGAGNEEPSIAPKRAAVPVGVFLEERI